MLHLIATVLIIGCVTIFAGFNLNNKCDINFIFRTFNDIPVFITIILSFLWGVLVTLPYVFVKRHSRQTKAEETVAAEPADKDDKKKTPFFHRKREGKKAAGQAESSVLASSETAKKSGIGEANNIEENKEEP